MKHIAILKGTCLKDREAKLVCEIKLTKMPTNKCNVCKKDVTKPAIACDACNKWFHPKCAKIQEEELRFLSKNKSTKWFCDKCCPEINAVLKNLQNFKDAGKYVKEMEEKMSQCWLTFKQDWLYSELFLLTILRVYSKRKKFLLV